MLDNQSKNVTHPRVSILIPVFNREEFIGDCIESALNQTFQDFEIIIFDNASTDKTWDICKKISLTDNRIKIFKQSNNIGPVRNWISCAQQARGEFAKILFSDDLLDPNCLEEMCSKLKDDIAFVYSSVKIGLSNDNAQISYQLRNGNLATINFNQYIKFLIKGEVPYSPGAALFRTKDLIKNIRLNFPTFIKRSYDCHGAGPDLMLFLLTFSQYCRVYFIPRPLVFFRSHLGSFSVGEMRAEVRDSYRSVISWFLKNNLSPYIWASYLSGEWVEVCRQDKFIPPRDFIKQYEWSQSCKEFILFALFVLFYVFKVVIKKLNQLYIRLLFK